MPRKSPERLEAYFLAVIANRMHGWGPNTLRWVLSGLSRLYSGIINLRLAMFEHRIIRSEELGCQVISIGNLTVGGTGKTPVVEVFARELQKNGRRVAILSRGYKKAELPFSEKFKNFVTFNTPKQQPPRIVSDGRRLLLDSAMGGDEPYMLASNLPDVCVLVDKDRVKSGRYAIQKLGCDTLILDDGFQYLRLKHRVDIVLVDRTNPFDNGRVLPRGLLFRFRDVRFISEHADGLEQQRCVLADLERICVVLEVVKVLRVGAQELHEFRERLIARFKIARRVQIHVPSIRGSFIQLRDIRGVERPGGDRLSSCGKDGPRSR